MLDRLAGCVEMFWEVVSKDVRRRWLCRSEIGCCWKGSMNVWRQCVQDNAFLCFGVFYSLAVGASRGVLSLCRPIVPLPRTKTLNRARIVL